MSTTRETVVFDLDLIQRYDRPGPRYTSYPTAPQFHADFDEAALRAELRSGNACGRPLSLYFHIPFCEHLLVREIMAEARELGCRSISLDLIYGLPFQTPASFAATLEQIIQLRPDRLSLFNYAHLPERFPPQRRIRAEDLPVRRKSWGFCSRVSPRSRPLARLHRHGSFRPTRAS